MCTILACKLWYLLHNFWTEKSGRVGRRSSLHHVDTQVVSGQIDIMFYAFFRNSFFFVVRNCLCVSRYMWLGVCGASPSHVDVFFRCARGSWIFNDTLKMGILPDVKSETTTAHVSVLNVCILKGEPNLQCVGKMFWYKFFGIWNWQIDICISILIHNNFLELCLLNNHRMYYVVTYVFFILVINHAENPLTLRHKSNIIIPFVQPTL